MALKFDPTINAGHLLTFGGMLISVAIAFGVLDKRIGVLEEKSASASSAATERTIEQKESLREIKADIKDLQRSVNEIGRAVAARSAPAGGGR